MRTIYYRKVKQPEYDKSGIRVAGSGGYTGFTYDGLFHQWVTLDNCLYALIEVPTGMGRHEMILVSYVDIRF